MFFNENKMSHLYPKKVPTVGEIVHVSIDKEEDQGFLCSLLEYDNLQGYLQMTELSRKRVRSVNSHAKLGQLIFLTVLRVDGKYVDLSKKFVGKAERTIGHEKYQRSKNLYEIFNHLAETLKKDREEMFTRIVWPLYSHYDYALKDSDEDYDSDEEVIEVARTHPYWSLKRFALNEEDIFAGIAITDDERSELKRILENRIKAEPINCQAIVDLTCYTEEGIDGIKRAAAKMRGECPEVSLKYRAAPEYYLTFTTFEMKEGEKVIKRAIESLTRAIETVGGECKMKEQIQFFTC